MTLLFDIEVYVNVFMVVFRDFETGKIARFQQTPNTTLDRAGLRKTLESNLLVGFNSRGYDLPLIQMALDDLLNYSCVDIKHASDRIINEGLTSFQFYKEYTIDEPRYDHIDLMPVAPLKASLKIYGGRLHCKKMQELPIDPSAEVTAEQFKQLYVYCQNDLDVTAALYHELRPQLELRDELSKEYRQDLRSRSDAQLAEYVISAEVERLTGQRVNRPEGLEGKQYRYNVPDYISFTAPHLQAMLETVRAAKFRVNDKGAIDMPASLADLDIRIGHGKYRMGIGGLHSSEKSVMHQATDNVMLIDRDVASYYPNIILTLGLYPKHMGPAFLEVYRSLVQRRLAAKKAGNKVVAESLKICVNGGFGKLGNKWSKLYSPDLLIQVTITGQLTLLMMIERLELAGIEVISGNTDGVVSKVRTEQYDTFLAVVKEWERITQFETEETRYRAVYSRDVNSYIAVKTNGKTKLKGAFANPWAEVDENGRNVFKLHKNPQTTICIEAVVALLVDGKPVLQTLHECRDVRKFLVVRKVGVGARKRQVDEDEQLGKAIRWYYSREVKGPLAYRTSKNKVPKSDGAKPLMELPAEFPKDLDYKWYNAEVQSMLLDIGYAQGNLFEEVA